MATIERGMLVMGQGSEIGTVEDVLSTGNEPERVLVRRLDGQTMMLEPTTYRIENGTVHLINRTLYETQRITDSDLTDTALAHEASDVEDVSAEQSTVIPVIQEDVHVGIRTVERGGVRVNKRVEEREEVVEQPVFREEVSVERTTIGRPIDGVIGTRQEGDTLIIPVLEEMLVVEKRLVLKEEIRITKRRIDETEKASVILREEHIDIEHIDEPT